MTAEPRHDNISPLMPDPQRPPITSTVTRLLHLARPEAGRIALGTLFLLVGSGLTLVYPPGMRNPRYGDRRNEGVRRRMPPIRTRSGAVSPVGSQARVSPVRSSMDTGSETWDRWDIRVGPAFPLRKGLP